MDWEFQYSANVDLKKPNVGIFKFSFPHEDGAHYLVKKTNGIKGKTLSMTYSINGSDPVFTAPPDDVPAGVRFYFQHKNDDMSGSGDAEFYRWWSNPVCGILRLGVQTLSVPLRPPHWSSVMGKPGTAAPDKFRDALRNAAVIGITFGGHFFGHGAWLSSGDAAFKLKSWTLTL